MGQVPIANRYNGAWAEINARLQSRQNVNITFTTIAVAAIAAMWSERSYYDAVYFFLPLYGLAATFWICHNDLIIGLLSKYCAECEKNHANNTIPAWHTPQQGWIEVALTYRRWTDRGFMIVLLLIVANNFFKVYSTWGSAPLKAMLSFFFTLPCLFAIWLINRNKRKRNEILNEWEFKDGKFKKITTNKTKE